MQPDPAEIVASLGYPPPAGAMIPVTGGWDTTLWRFTTADGREHALRLFRIEQAAPAEREREAILAAGAGGIPVPDVEVAGAWHDRPALIQRWLPGETLAAALQRRPWAVRRLAGEFARVQAHLHALAVPKDLRAGAPHYWLRAEAIGDPPLIERLLAVPLLTSQFVHLDYHPLNVMVDGPRISGVLDWVNAAAGDARADIARTSALLLLAPLPFPLMLRPIFKILLRQLHRTWARTYVQIAGRPSGLAPFMAWAGARFARDTERHVGQPGVWATADDIAPMWRWTERWKRRAGIG